MPNIARLLKSEITRLARKEVRGETAALRKSSAVHRRQIAALKREIAALQRQSKQASRNALKQSKPTVEGVDAQHRFSAKGLMSLRARLGLSANDMALLLGASMQSVYNWERGQTIPRSTQVAAIAALRSMGKREAMQRLEKARPAAKMSRKR
jgi:DNA-binding transcriptional regulator YiaG